MQRYQNKTPRNSHQKSFSRNLKAPSFEMTDSMSYNQFQLKVESTPSNGLSQCTTAEKTKELSSSGSSLENLKPIYIKQIYLPSKLSKIKP